jgi:hypothetical protein
MPIVVSIVFGSALGRISGTAYSGDKWSTEAKVWGDNELMGGDDVGRGGNICIDDVRHCLLACCGPIVIRSNM